MGGLAKGKQPKTEAVNLFPLLSVSFHATMLSMRCALSAPKIRPHIS